MGHMDAHALNFGTEKISLSESHNRILAEDIRADRDFPPFNRSAMDGIAIKVDEAEKTDVFKIAGMQPAGAPQQDLKSPSSCLEIMTGAILPNGADAVIRYEDVTLVDGHAKLNIKGLTQWMNVHKKGTDGKENDLLIKSGKRLTVGDIGILATVGKEQIVVNKLPKVALISTGDELVEVSDTPEMHQIRKSNIHSLAVLLKNHSIDFELFHFDDDEESLIDGLKSIIEKFNVLMLSGGVSMGKRDFLPTVFERLGIKKTFHRIAQRPGKPMWFGKNQDVTVFGFPGNPVSTLVCFTVYFKRWLSQCLGETNMIQTAKLADSISFKPDLTYHVPVSLINRDAVLEAVPYIGSGSGDLTVLSYAKAFITLPDNSIYFEKGEDYQIHLI